MSALRGIRSYIMLPLICRVFVLVTTCIIVAPKRKGCGGSVIYLASCGVYHGSATLIIIAIVIIVVLNCGTLNRNGDGIGSDSARLLLHGGWIFKILIHSILSDIGVNSMTIYVESSR